jgi:hypothetical protein
MQNMDGTTGAIMATLVLAGVSSATSVRDGWDDHLIREQPPVVPEIMELFGHADGLGTAERAPIKSQLHD